MDEGDGTAGLDAEYQHGAFQDARDGLGGDVNAHHVAAAGAAAEQRRAHRRADNIPEGNQ